LANIVFAEYTDDSRQTYFIKVICLRTSEISNRSLLRTYQHIPLLVFLDSYLLVVGKSCVSAHWPQCADTQDLPNTVSATLSRDYIDRRA